MLSLDLSLIALIRLRSSLPVLICWEFRSWIVVEILSTFFLLNMMFWDFSMNYIDFLMLAEPYIPEINPTDYGILSFLYIARFYLLIFCYIFGIYVHEEYWFVTVLLPSFLPPSLGPPLPLSFFFVSNAFSRFGIRVTLVSQTKSESTPFFSIF